MARCVVFLLSTCSHHDQCHSRSNNNNNNNNNSNNTIGPLNMSTSHLFANLGRKIPQPRAMTGKKLFCSRKFRGSATLSCYTIPGQPLTVRIDDLYPILHYLNFKTPSGTYLPRVKNNNNKTIYTMP